MIACDVGRKSLFLESVEFLQPEAGVFNGLPIHILRDDKVQVFVIRPILERNFVEVVIGFVGLLIDQLIQNFVQVLWLHDVLWCRLMALSFAMLEAMVFEVTRLNVPAL